MRYLRLRIRPCTNHNPDRQNPHRQNLHRRIQLPSPPARRHCRHASKAAQNDMHRHADIERKSPIVQHIDRVEHGRAEEQLMEGYLSASEKERRVGE